MSKVVAFVNMKGGVGKTTVSASMAEASAAMGKRVLFLDLDPQINASMTIVGNCDDDFTSWKKNNTIETILENLWQGQGVDINNFIVDFGLAHPLSWSHSIALFERRLLTAAQNFFQYSIATDPWIDYILD